MSASREELLTYGYIKEYHERNNIELPPDDLILLFVSWIQLMDVLDKTKCHRQIVFDPEKDTRFKAEYIPATFVAAIGTIIVEKGMKQTWKLKIDQTYPLLGIMEDEIINSKYNITDHTNSENGGYGMQLTNWNLYPIAPSSL